jgi:hypothetical protein
MAYDPSKDPMGYDPSNPNTAMINGDLYVWQPSTAGQDAQNYLGANADPSVVNQDTSPASGNGSWVPASYEHPNGQFWSLLAKVVGGTSAAEFALPYLLGTGASSAAGATGAASTAPATTSAGLGSLPVSTFSGGAGTTVPLTAAGVGGAANLPPPGSNKKTPPPKTAMTVPSWVTKATAAIAPTLGHLVGGGSSDLTNSLTQALTGLVPDLKQSFDLGIQRQQQASPLYDAVLKMALGRLPNWSTGGGE